MSVIGFLIAGRGDDNHCWFCRARHPAISQEPSSGKRSLCPSWCVRRMMDYTYHRSTGKSVVWGG